MKKIFSKINLGWERKDWVIFTSLIIMGWVISFAVIPWQTPDETVHVEDIGDEWGNPELFGILKQDMQMDSGRLAFQSNNHISFSMMKQAMTKKPGYSVKSVLPHGLTTVKAVRHFPAAVGLFLGLLLHVPTYWAMRLGELFALLFYTFICTETIHIVPVKKWIFFLVSAMPMSLQMGASLNYDAVLLPICFLFTGIVILYASDSAKILRWREIILLVLLLFIIGTIKLPYAFMALMVFCIPFNRIILFNHNGVWNIKKAVLSYGIVILAIVVLGILGIYVKKDDLYVRILISCMKFPHQTLKLLHSTEQSFRGFIVNSMVGQFGYLDTPIPLSAAYIFVNVSIVLALTVVRKNDSDSVQGKKVTWKWFDRLLTFVISIGLTVLVTIALINHTYLTFTYGAGSEYTVHSYYDTDQAIFKIPYIGGIQGRYYIPAFLLFLYAMPDVFETKKNKMIIITDCMVGVFFVMSVYVIIRRYFG